MPNYLSIKINPTEYKNFEVPQEVYIYVRQLELAIKFPKQSKIKKLYPERFNTILNENPFRTLNFYQKILLKIEYKIRKLYQTILFFLLKLLKK